MDTSSRGTNVRGSRSLQAAVGDTADHILFLHAITGCDTTSYLYKQSKDQWLKKLMDSKQLRDTVSVYNNPGSSLDQLSAAGEIFLLHLYGFPKAGTLDKARYAMYKRTIARQPLTSKFDLATLPPTSASSRLHFARVYLQVQAWRGIQLNPLDWGWHTGRLASAAES